MTSTSRIVTTIAVAGSMLAGQAAVLASSASARDFRHGDRGRHYERPAPRHYAPRFSHRSRRDHTGDAVAATILGLGAVIIGSAIADAHRNRRDRYDD